MDARESSYVYLFGVLWLGPSPTLCMAGALVHRLPLFTSLGPCQDLSIFSGKEIVPERSRLVVLKKTY